MSFTYNLKTLATTKRDQVRLKLGDTSETVALLQDEELDFLLTESGSVVAPTVLAAARTVLAKYAARPTSMTSGRTSVDWDGIFDRMRSLIQEIQLGVAGGAKPYAGGTSLDDIEKRDQDEDYPGTTWDETGP